MEEEKISLLIKENRQKSTKLDKQQFISCTKEARDDC
jgi:hypothetical protein